MSVLDVDANKVIEGLARQIKQMAIALAVKEAQIELLQQKIVKLKAEKEKEIEAKKEQTA